MVLRKARTSHKCDRKTTCLIAVKFTRQAKRFEYKLFLHVREAMVMIITKIDVVLTTGREAAADQQIEILPTPTASAGA